MAGNTKKRGTMGTMPDFVRMQVEAAEKRLVAFEEEAQRLLKELIVRGKESRKEVRDLLKKAHDFELGGAWKGKTGAEMMKRVEELQDRALGAIGVASTAQIEELAAEIQRLARRIDRMTKTANKAQKPKAKRNPPASPSA